MKVLLIAHSCQSRTEGQPRAVELAKLDVELRVIVPRRWNHYGRWRAPDKPEPGARFRLQPLSIRAAWCGPAQSYLHFYPGLGRVLREFAPDVIDLWEEPWSAVSVQACLLRERICPGAALVSETEQNIDKTLPPPFEPFRSFVLGRADWVVGRSDEALRIVERKGFAGRSRVVPNAVDAELFHPLAPDERARQRKQLGWNDDEFVAGYVGRLVEEKGLSDFVAAMAKCSSRVRAVLVGEGPFEANLRAHISSLGLDGRVQILPARSPQELAPLMGALDVLVLPSRTTARWKEQFGRVIIEAHACAVPVVGSDSGAIPDVVGAAGRVFPEGDDAELARHLEELALHPGEARSLGLAGRQTVEARYTWARVAEAMHAIYSELRPPS